MFDTDSVLLWQRNAESGDWFAIMQAVDVNTARKAYVNIPEVHAITIGDKILKLDFSKCLQSNG